VSRDGADVEWRPKEMIRRYSSNYHEVTIEISYE
jgi:hypothetical protein